MNKIIVLSCLLAFTLPAAECLAGEIGRVTFKSPWSRTAVRPDTPGTPAAELAARIAATPSSADGRKLWTDALKLRTLRTGKGNPPALQFRQEGGFFIADDRENDTVYYTNGRIGLGFSGVSSGNLRLSSLYDFASRLEWITKTDDSAYFWDITFRKDGKNIRRNSRDKAEQFSFTGMAGMRLTPGSRSLRTPRLPVGGFPLTTSLTIRDCGKWSILSFPVRENPDRWTVSTRRGFITR